MPNRLINEKSPYLLMHAGNPVDWYPWGDEAFAAAKQKKVPVFLSIGYSSCHWCHVMERESFIDNSVADMLNKGFISVKVDREELPEVDNFYMSACEAFNRSGGWPLTVFLNHDRTPFYAGTYFPPEALKSLLSRISELWAKDRKRLADSGKGISEYIRDSGNAVKTPGNADISGLSAQIAASSDKVNGGNPGAPKFPDSPKVSYLLAEAINDRNSKGLPALTKALDGMAFGGLFDHTGGGFFRYSTDATWTIPHFEKMLYDNAQLLRIYAVAAALIDPKYRLTAERTAEYLMKEMRSPEGGFYTAEDADSEGVEGKFYLFSLPEIRDCLKAEAKNFIKEYGVTAQGNFHGLNHLRRERGNVAALPDARLDKLFNYRRGRAAPLTDDKIITSLNGLAIEAFAVSGKALNKPEWIDAAIKCAEFIEVKLRAGGRLMTRYREGEAAFPGTLEDYAFYAKGLNALYAVTLNSKWLETAVKTADEMLELFSDPSGGAMYFSGGEGSGLPYRLKREYDHAAPSGNAAAARVFYELYLHTEDEKYRAAYEGIITSGSAVLAKYPFASLSLAETILFMEKSAHVTIKGMDAAPLINELMRVYRPFAVCTVKQDVSGKAEALICAGNACLPQVNTPETLKRVLDNL